MSTTPVSTARTGSRRPDVDRRMKEATAEEVKKASGGGTSGSRRDMKNLPIGLYIKTDEGQWRKATADESAREVRGHLKGNTEGKIPVDRVLFIRK
jgi:hypothetical protein